MRKSCHHYESCSAPICPLLSGEELESSVWYPDEEICHLKCPLSKDLTGNVPEGSSHLGSEELTPFSQALTTEKAPKTLLKLIFENDLVRRQKKIQSRCKKSLTYFIPRMLRRNFRIGNGLKGLDPDKPEGPQLTLWEEKHPILRTERTEAEKIALEKMCSRLEEYRKKKASQLINNEKVTK